MVQSMALAINTVSTPILTVNNKAAVMPSDLLRFYARRSLP